MYFIVNPVELELQKHLPDDLVPLCLAFCTDVPFMNEYSDENTHKIRDYILGCGKTHAVSYIDAIPLPVRKHNWVFVACAYSMSRPDMYVNVVLPLTVDRPGKELDLDMRACAAFGMLKEVQTIHELLGIPCSSDALYLAGQYGQHQTLKYLYDHGARIHSRTQTYLHFPTETIHFYVSLIMQYNERETRARVSTCKTCTGGKKKPSGKSTTDCLIC